jgi:hypothetical protein
MTAPQEPTNPSNLFTPFIESTYNIPEEEDRGRAFLNDKLSSISDVVNSKKIGTYTDNVENFNGEEWNYLNTKKIRNGYQTIVYIPSFISQTIPNPIPRVNPQLIVTHTWGSASRPCSAIGAGDGNYFSFYTLGNTNITYTLSDTQIVITTTIDLSAYKGFIVIEYLHDGI